MRAILGALWRLEYFRYNVYGKRVSLLTDQQALQPILKRNSSQAIKCEINTLVGQIKPF